MEKTELNALLSISLQCFKTMKTKAVEIAPAHLNFRIPDVSYHPFTERYDNVRGFFVEILTHFEMLTNTNSSY